MTSAGTPQAYIVSGRRTPVGRYGGALSSVRPDDLAALVVKAVVTDAGIDPSVVDEVILGNANGAGEENRNVARMAWLLAGFPDTVPGITVNRLCASGMSAIAQATWMVRAGAADVVVAGGVESMSRAPWVMAKPSTAFAKPGEVFDTSIGWRFTNPVLAAQEKMTFSMPETAEEVARVFGINRHDADEFAVASHQKALAAIEAGHFDAEIVPVEVRDRKGRVTVVGVDEGPRAGTSMEVLAKLRPVVEGGEVVTAGNASSLNDGASAVLVVSERAAEKYGLTPRVRVVESTAVGVPAPVMGIGPVPATRKALERSGWGLDEIGAIELNEAFASQSLACIRELGLDPEVVTAGNASSLNDGASAVLVVSERAAEKYGLTPRVRVVDSTSVGVPAPVMGIGPVPATRKALERTGWSLDEIGAVELNEAFASQSLACIRELGLDPERVNRDGGAIALGHPLGSSGSRIIVTLMNRMEREGADKGLATMCVGVGQGTATLLERVR